MYQPDLLTFRRTDQVPEDFEHVAKEFADHFKVKRNYLRQFCKLIQTSKKWNITNLTSSLTRWAQFFGAVQGREKIINLVQRAFDLCQTDMDIDNLRGIIVESILIAACGGSAILSDPSYGWGSKVYLKNDNGRNDVIRYHCCEHKMTECGNRATVDLAKWNGYSGSFYECKANPISIGCKEISYMNYLRQQLEDKSVSHETFFVCTENAESIQIRLAEFNCSPLLKPLGIEKLESMIA